MKNTLTNLAVLALGCGQYADPADWPAGSPYGPFNQYQPIGKKTVAEAIAAINSK